jgi:Cohesin domain
MTLATPNTRLSDRFARAMRISLSAIMVTAWGLVGPASAEQLSIPTDVIGANGQQAIAPVNLANITTGFVSAAFNVAYDPTRITSTGATLGPAASGKGCNIERNDVSTSEVRVAVFCTGTVDTTGELVRLAFNVVGAASQTSPLNFVSGQCRISLNIEGDVPCTTSDGLLTIVAAHTLSGKIIYYNGLDTRPLVPQERPLADATVNLSGAATDSTDTAADGTYSLNTLEGQLTLQPRKRGNRANDIVDAITAFDAALVAQHVAGLITLNARQLIAADANGTGIVAANDASQIARFDVGSLDELKMEADCNTAFAFIPDATAVANQTFQQPNTDVRPPGQGGPGCVYGEIHYDPLTANAAGQDFIAILMGDVSGNWQPAVAPITAALASASSPIKLSPATVSVGKKRAKSGSVVTLPIKITKPHGAIGVDIDLSYDPSVLVPLLVEKTVLSRDMTLEQYIGEPGVIRISLFGVQGLQRPGKLLKVSFSVIGQGKQVSPVEISHALVNENLPATSNGQVKVK